jgi:UMF1 family MFS transporter
MADDAPQPLPEAPARSRWLTREVFGWGMFDFANQAFTLVIITTMFQLFFTKEIVPGGILSAAEIQAGRDAADVVKAARVAGDADLNTVAPTVKAAYDALIAAESDGRQLWSLSGVIGLCIVIALSPLIGALADFSGAKKKLLLITYIFSVIFTASLALLTPGAVTLAMVLFIIGYTFYAIGENFMSSFLPELATQRTIGRVSAFGWSMGYFGGLCCLAGAAAISGMFKQDPVTGHRLICLWAALFFFLAGLPTFLFVRERKQAEQMPTGHTIFTIGFVRLADTFRSIRRYTQLFRYLGIMTFYYAGMQVIIWFAGTIAEKMFGLEQSQMAIYLLVITVTSIIGALLSMQFQDRIGTKRMIMACLVLWLVVIGAAGFVRGGQMWMFWTLGSGIGLGLGMLGTASRAMVGLFSPHHKAAEFFGFYGLAHKLSAICGLGLTYFAETVFGERFHLVVASSSIFFVGGIVFMFFVDEKAGHEAAEKATREHEARHHDYIDNPAPA